jgi:hypothetical protein
VGAIKPDDRSRASAQDCRRGLNILYVEQGLLRDALECAEESLHLKLV